MAVRILLLTGWALLPVAGWAYHVGPGQEQKALDEAAKHVRAAEAAAADKDYTEAVEEYAAAIKALPEGRAAEARKLRLEKAKAQMLCKQLPEAHADLKVLADEVAADPGADPKLAADIRSAAANSQYYATWLMRLEGAPRAEWEAEIESARQGYKLLAEEAEKKGDAAAAAKFKEDLEAAVRLERLELAELQGLPLPSQ